jgi:hypothetical protein
MPNVVVVSIPKCGTNLIGRLFGSMGYHVTGEGIDNAFPSWCRRLDAEFVLRFPPRTCCMFHSLPASAMDAGLARMWRERGTPKVIFNYRDPRAALVSMINYLVGDRYSGAGWQQVGADILRSLAGRERIAFGADYFDEFLFQKYRQSAWLLQHPQVLSVAFERLIGPDGGGSADAQAREVARILDFVGERGSPEALSQQVFDRTSRTFSQGTIGGWRADFGPEELSAFDARHGDILRTFGYPA